MQGSENQDFIFEDITKNGRKRKWREKKLSSIDLANRLEILGYRSFDRVYQCGEVLKFMEQADGTKKLAQAYFCKNKLCAICNWRRSLKYSYQSELIINEALNRIPKGRFVFITLTVKNVAGEDLNKTISAMSVGFNRLMKYKAIERNVEGYLRSTEVTYSEGRGDYHPHLHVLLFVKPSYFKGGKYIKQSDWSSYWQKAMKLEYTPVVDVRAVKPRNGKNEEEEIRKAILETAKYPVKPFDVVEKDGLSLTEEDKLQITDDMMNGLYRKRQIGFGGIFKEIKKELELDDVEDGNLVRTGDDTESVSTGREIVAIWNWERKNYVVKA